MYKVELEFKCEDLDILLNKDLHLPPYVYHLPEGLKTTDIKFPSKVGPWGICWVGTKGKQTQGSLILFPRSSYARKAIKSRMVKYYQANGFTHNEAKALSKINIKSYYDKDLLAQIMQIESMGVLAAFRPYIYQTEPLTRHDLETLRKVFSDILKDRVELNRTPVLGIPLIGCGLAGGDWEVVKEMLNNLIVEFDEAIKVAVYIV